MAGRGTAVVWLHVLGYTLSIVCVGASRCADVPLLCRAFDSLLTHFFRRGLDWEAMLKKPGVGLVSVPCLHKRVKRLRGRVRREMGLATCRSAAQSETAVLYRPNGIILERYIAQSVPRCPGSGRCCQQGHRCVSWQAVPTEPGLEMYSTCIR